MTEIHYRPGEWQAAVTPQGVAVLPATMEADMLGRIWASLQAGHGLGAVLESLTGAFGTSLRAIPPFAVVTFGADEVRLAVRGPIEIEVVEADASYGVSGAEVTTWSERVVRSPQRLVVRTDAPGGDAAYGVADAIVLCAELMLTFGPTTPSRAPSAPRSASTSATIPEETIAPPEQASAPTPSAASSGHDSPHTSEDGTNPDHSLADEMEYTQTELPDDAYDHLWGATVVKSVEHAAVREVDEAEEDEPARASGLRAEAGASEKAPTDADADADAAAAPVGGSGFAPPAQPARSPEPWTAPPFSGLIDSVPGFGGVGASSSSTAWPEASGGTASPAGHQPNATIAPAAAPGTPTPTAGDDHDGLTVTVTELEALRQLAAAGSDADAAANADPAAAAIPPAPAAGSGRMTVLSTGESYPLDHPIVIGRRPRANRVQADQVPVLVTVASPEQDISRNHLEVRIEGRHVLAVDLDTTNGSVLHREGTPPLRLAANEPVLLLSDDVIDLGDGITVLFEDLP